MHAYFRKFAHATSTAIGTPYAFVIAVVAVILWAACGPLFGFSDTWQLVINTSTTIVTFLVVFMIQNTQNRDSRAIHLKLDELIRAMKTARNKLVDVEELSDEELERLENQFRALRSHPDRQGRRKHAKSRKRSGHRSTPAASATPATSRDATQH